MSQTYLWPADFDTTVYASQLLQAQAIRYGVEHFRRHRGRCMGTVVWQLADSMGRVRFTKSETVTAGPLSAVWLDRNQLEQADLYTDHVSYRLLEDGEEISSGSVLFCPPKYYKFCDPHLTFRLEGDEIVVNAEAYARDVEIRNDSEDMILSDNYFDMEPGEKRVRILRGKPSGIRLRSTFDIR